MNHKLFDADGSILKPLNDFALAPFFFFLALSLNSTSLFLRTLQGEVLRPPPVWLMRQAGRYLPEYRTLRETYKDTNNAKDAFLAFCRTESATTQAALQPLLRFPLLDAAIVFSDILFIAEALGLPVSFQEGGPKIEKPLDEKAIEQLLAQESDLDPSRYAFATRACHGLRHGLKQKLNQTPRRELPVIGFAGAPWTLACYLLQSRAVKGFPLASDFVRRAPALADAFLSLLARETAELLWAQRAGGAEALQLFDSWSGLLTGTDNERFSLAPAVAVFNHLREKEARQQESPETGQGIPLIFHAREAGVAWQTAVQEFSSLQVALSPDSTTDLAGLVALLEAEERNQGLAYKIAIQGNLDPSLLLPTSPMSDLLTAVQEKAQGMRGRPWIVNLGAGIAPDADPERVAELLRAVKEIQE